LEKKPFIDEQHVQTRNSLRLFGILFILVALILIIIGFKDAFLKPIDTFSNTQIYFGEIQFDEDLNAIINGNSSSNPFGKFWLMFIGIPLLAIGIAMTRAGYIGKVAEYGSKELTPVAKDAWNYLKENDASTPSPKNNGGHVVNAIQCNSCQHLNATTSIYCNQCGNAL
jgi:hypothetical protein